MTTIMSEVTIQETCLHESKQKEGAGKEVAIQTDAQELERNSGKIPLRKRFVPLKFSDYCVFANNIKQEDEEEEDASFSITEATSSTKNITLSPKRGDKLRIKSRGRPRKSKEIPTNIQETGDKQNSSEKPSKKNPITKMANGFKCGICGKVFTLRGNAKTHLLTHTDSKPFKCDFEDCEKQMRTKESLRRHKLSHLGIKLFECSECHKKFSCNLSLQEHMTLHTGEKRLTCEICDMKFRQVAVMKRHLITHSEEKPFSCEICGKKFSLKIYVRSHMKTHTGEKPFSCSVCEKSFAHASDLNRHKIIHSGEKPYKCSVCSMRYSDPSSRRRHEREHENRPQFVCHLCNKQFTRVGQLRVHLVKEHTSPTGSLQEENRIPFQIKVETTQSQSIENGSMLSIIPNMLTMVDPVSKQEGSNHIRLGLTEDANSTHQFDPGKETNLVSIQHFIPEIQNAIQTFVMKNHDPLPANRVYKFVETTDGNHLLELQLEEKSSLRSGISKEENTLNLMDIKDNDEKVAFTYDGETLTVVDPGQTNNSQEHVNIIIENNKDVNESDDRINDQYINRIVPTNDGKSSITLLLPNPDEKGEVGAVFETQIEEQEIVQTSEMPLSVNPVIPTHQNIVVVDSTNYNLSINTENEIVLNQNEEMEIDNTSVISSPFIDNPDLYCQEYYNWLSTFCEECKNFDMPLSNDNFRKISRVHKTLSDFLAMPTGVISDKSNYKTLMGITHDLFKITSKHLSLIYSQLNE